LWLSASTWGVSKFFWCSGIPVFPGGKYYHSGADLVGRFLLSISMKNLATGPYFEWIQEKVDQIAKSFCKE
jgi:hypothetical protein